MTCENGGGIAAIIWNSYDGILKGYLASEDSQVTIPVIGVQKDAGNMLLEGAAMGNAVTIKSKPGYTYMGKLQECICSLKYVVMSEMTLYCSLSTASQSSSDGTSMATPHVTGAVVDIWRGCRYIIYKCQNSYILLFPID